MKRLLFSGLLIMICGAALVESSRAQSSADPTAQQETVLPQTASGSSSLQVALQAQLKDIARSSAKTIDPVLEALLATQSPALPTFLERWKKKEVWLRKSDQSLYYVEPQAETGGFDLIDIESGMSVASAGKRDLKQLKPNSGVRAKLAAAQVQFQLLSPDVSVRRTALESLKRDADASHLPILRKALEQEIDTDLKADFARLELLLTISFDQDQDRRLAVIAALSSDLSLEARARLNPLLSSKLKVADSLPEGVNLARIVIPGQSLALADGSARNRQPIDWLQDRQAELSLGQAYALLVDAGRAPAAVSKQDRDAALVAHVRDGQVAGIPLADFSSEEKRDLAYAALAWQGLVTAAPSQADQQRAVDAAVFYAAYDEPNPAITEAARQALASINKAVGFNALLDLALDAISLASIYFLAAIGLAITFGVMRVINMAHGEFIMMGAYTGYVVQLLIPNYTLSLLAAIPAAFLVTFAAGVLLERLVIRHLYNRPLETLLSTFGVSIALQQVAKNIFGTQARPLTAPAWLDGSLVLNDVVSISWIRIAIFVLGMLFFAGLWWTLNKTRLGLETRAVTQNSRMASSMGINPDRVNMLIFGLGSGIAGIAGVAIGLYAKVTSEMGADYIVQSYMTVVIGGVGNIWGTLAGAGMIGILQKLIEGFNPSNTLAAQTYMIIFIIIFIQFRPRGLFALKGRAAEV